MIGWLVTAKAQFGELTVDSTGSKYVFLPSTNTNANGIYSMPMLVGNVVALLSPVVFVPILTYSFGPQRYDWKSMLAIRLGDDKELADEAHVDLEAIPGHRASVTHDMVNSPEFIAEQQHLTRSVKVAGGLTIFLAVALLVIWPMPMFGSSYVFSREFFTGWVVVGIIWLFFSTFCVGLYPLWEGRRSIARVFKAAFKDLSGKGGRSRYPVHEAQEDFGETSSQEIGEITEKPKQ